MAVLLNFLYCGCVKAKREHSMEKDVPKVSLSAEEEQISGTQYKYITAETPIFDVIEHPAFKGYGRFIFPWDDTGRYRGLTMRDAPSLHLWHTNMNVEEMLAGVNRMIDDVNKGERIFYDIYTEKAKAADPTKRLTGMFFFRGNPGAPFAIVCPGGGFYYVGSLHGGFPLAMELNRHGYNVFVLKYRVHQDETMAARDLIAAVNFVLTNSEALGVSDTDFSLWGGSAGAGMVSDVSYGEAGIKRNELVRPAAAIMAYTTFAGNPDFQPDDPAGFMIVGTEDWIVPVRHVEKRVAKMRRVGIDVECVVLKNTLHGFGIGKGTAAEGWIDRAVLFWEKTMKHSNQK